MNRGSNTNIRLPYINKIYLKGTVIIMAARRIHTTKQENERRAKVNTFIESLPISEGKDIINILKRNQIRFYTSIVSEEYGHDLIVCVEYLRFKHIRRTDEIKKMYCHFGFRVHQNGELEQPHAAIDAYEETREYAYSKAVMLDTIPVEDYNKLSELRSRMSIKSTATKSYLFDDSYGE